MKGVKCRDKYYGYCSYNKIESTVEAAIAPNRLLVHFCFIALCEEKLWLMFMEKKNLSRVTFSGPRGLMLGRKCVGEDADCFVRGSSRSPLRASEIPWQSLRWAGDLLSLSAWLPWPPSVVRWEKWLGSGCLSPFLSASKIICLCRLQPFSLLGCLAPWEALGASAAVLPSPPLSLYLKGAK